MLPLIGAGIGLAGGIGKMFARGRANKDLRELMGQDPRYAENPYAAEKYSFARALLNSRMPGALAAERNIYGTQSNALAGLQRNATDASQLLATAGAVQGQTQNAFGDLAMQEAQDYQRRFGNYAAANQDMVAEGDKMYNDQLRRYGNQVQMQGAINENKAAMWGDISNMGFGLGDFLGAGGADGLKGLFGKKGAGQSMLAGSNVSGFNFNRLPITGIDQAGNQQAMSNLPSLQPNLGVPMRNRQTANYNPWRNM